MRQVVFSILNTKNINQTKLNGSMEKSDQKKENYTEKSDWKKPEVRELNVTRSTRQLAPPGDPMQS